MNKDWKSIIHHHHILPKILFPDRKLSFSFQALHWLHHQVQHHHSHHQVVGVAVPSSPSSSSSSSAPAAAAADRLALAFASRQLTALSPWLQSKHGAPNPATTTTAHLLHPLNLLSERSWTRSGCRWSPARRGSCPGELDFGGNLPDSLFAAGPSCPLPCPPLPALPQIQVLVVDLRE